ncbi:hypothetical protein CU081_17575 [Enterobacter sp. CRENT-193]|jgi:hypothetical protein|nr:hypothetical protein CU081_17575 [Enterobacter sp. CRENT-193]
MGADWRVRNPWQPQAQDGVSALEAPPGFRAAPHAANGVMSIRLQSLTPSRLAALRAPLAGIQTR